MKTRLMSRIALISLLLSAAAASGSALADQPGHDGYRARTGQAQFDQPSLLKVHYYRHHRRHHRHRRYDR